MTLARLTNSNKEKISI